MAIEALTASVEAMFKDIADEIENALRNEAEHLFANHPAVKIICWCMGVAQVACGEIEDWDGEEVHIDASYPDFGGRPTPEFLKDFFDIAELDGRLYMVLTGRPRRYERLEDGSIEQITDW